MYIEIKDLSVKYGNAGREAQAIEGLDLRINSGEICALIGPSGCGKTTLLYVLAGIIKNYTGRVLLGGAKADPKRQRIGLIPQNYALLEWASVYKNAALGAEITGRNMTKQEVISFLSDMGLRGLENKYPNSLSGGERQRVSIARSFLMKPDILLMDEPFSALDAITRENMQNMFLSIWSKYRPTVVFVTHSIEEAVYLGQSIAIMTASPGRIAEVIENPLCGFERSRTAESYYGLILEIRKNVEALWKAC